MVVQFVPVLVLAFVLIVAASYLGTKMALRSFFGREFVDPDTGEFVLPSDDRGDTDR